MLTIQMRLSEAGLSRTAVISFPPTDLRAAFCVAPDAALRSASSFRGGFRKPVGSFASLAKLVMTAAGRTILRFRVQGFVDLLAARHLMRLFLPNMTCSRCENLDECVRFRTRGELFRAVGTIRQAVSDGDLEEIDAGPTKGAIAFSDLSEAGPLDDLLLYRFRCSDCGQNFVLGVETYHGSGGSWGKSAPLGSA